VQTDDLIAVLAADTKPLSRVAPPLRLGLSAGLGALVALGLVLVWLGLRPDLAQAVQGATFWLKVVYTAALALSGYWATTRMARPGLSARGALRLAAAILALALIAGLAQLARLSGPQSLIALQGVSWQVCTLNIVVLAAPMTALVLYIVRQLAPTRPMPAGFACGAFSGAVAATVYGLHCPEQGPAFIALWYTLGVLFSGGLGAVAGRWLLRW